VPSRSLRLRAPAAWQALSVGGGPNRWRLSTRRVEYALAHAIRVSRREPC
jgi:hypothetical protein